MEWNEQRPALNLFERRFMLYLQGMDHLVHRIADGDCFIIFHEENEDDKASSLRAARHLSRRIRIPVGVVAGGTFDESLDFSEWLSNEHSVEGWTDDEERESKRGDRRWTKRFVQFCFSKRWFAMDLPNTTLAPPEARRLLSARDSFFRNADVPDFRISSPRQIEQIDPVCKFYEYGAEAQAAKDTAFIFWNLWRLTYDTQLFVTASSFDNRGPAKLDSRPIDWRE